jgi:hypothetical protein
VSHVARPFVLSVREKYHSAAEQLVIRVGELNFRRWSKFRPSAPTNINPDVDVKDLEDKSVISESLIAPSKHDRYSHTTRSTFSAPSIFDKESEPEPETETPQVVIRRRRPESVTSVRTSIATGASKPRKSRIPRLPNKLRMGELFRCQFCQELLGDVRNQSQWR